MITELTWIRPEGELDTFMLRDKDENPFAIFFKEDGFVSIEHNYDFYSLRQTGKLHTVIEVRSGSDKESNLLGTYEAGFGQTGTFTALSTHKPYKWKSSGKGKWSWFYYQTEVITIKVAPNQPDKNGPIKVVAEFGDLDSLLLIMVGWYLALLNADYLSNPKKL